MFTTPEWSNGSKEIPNPRPTSVQIFAAIHHAAGQVLQTAHNVHGEVLLVTAGFFFRIKRNSLTVVSMVFDLPRLPVTCRYTHALTSIRLLLTNSTRKAIAY